MDTPCSSHGLTGPRSADTDPRFQKCAEGTVRSSCADLVRQQSWLDNRAGTASNVQGVGWHSEQCAGCQLAQRAMCRVSAVTANNVQGVGWHSEQCAGCRLAQRAMCRVSVGTAVSSVQGVGWHNEQCAGFRLAQCAGCRLAQ